MKPARTPLLIELELDQPEPLPVVLLTRLLRVVTLLNQELANYLAHLESVEITRSLQMDVVRTLLYCDECRQTGITLRELREHLVVGKSKLAVLVHRLERANLIIRKIDSGNRRTHRIHLTTQAQALHTQLKPLLIQYSYLLVETLTQVEQDEMLSSLSRVSDGRD